MKEKIVAYTILFLFVAPSLLYASTSFEYFSSEHASRKVINNMSKQYIEYANEDKLNIDTAKYEGYRYFFYYQNYENYKNYLSKYKNISFKNFIIKFKGNQ